MILKLIYTLVCFCLLVLSFPEILRLNVKEVAERLGYFRSGLLVGGAIQGARCLGLSLRVIIDNHKKLFTPHLDTLKIKLREVKTEYEVMKGDYEDGVTKHMAGRH